MLPWPELSELPRHFDLYGGTGLALRVGGRQSEDFDQATLIRSGITLAQALGAARGLYPDFAPLVSLKALSYVEDGDLPELPEDIRGFLSESAAAVQELPAIPRRAGRLSG